MRTFRIALMALAISITGAVATYAQSADEIIQKHIEAVGGLENWKKIKTMKLTGNISMQGMEMPVTITTQNSKGMKVEFSMNGMTGYMIVTDKAGWNYVPFGGQTKPEALPDEMVKQMQDALDVQGSLIDYKAKGHKVVYLGKDDVEGTDCFKLKMTKANGKEETLYFDASNYYHIRSVEKTTANGKEVEQTSTYGNFQKLPEGIVCPMSIDQGNGPMAVKSVEINKAIPDNFFHPAELDTKK